MQSTEPEGSKGRLDTRRIVIFLGLAYGLAWLGGLAIYLTGGLTNGPRVGSAIPLAFILLLFPYMTAPAMAHILTRLITREGWKDVGLRPYFRNGWRYWLLGWVMPGLLTAAGGAIFFLQFPRYFDSSLAVARQGLAGGRVRLYHAA